jgi:bacillithiol biosynthesis cysteine-adding enzyme BshC
MKVTYIPRNKTNSFTDQQLLLSENQNLLHEFIGIPFSKEAFKKQIQLKSENYNQANRLLLHSVLKSKYTPLECNSKSLENIDKLANANCFTITTGHQLNLLTGPIYFIYKIIHVIKQCEELNQLYPNNLFVPIYWMASEDHDFEEIKSVSIFGKTLNWETNQTGAVGRMNLLGIPEVIQAFKEFFNTTKGNEVIALINQFNGKTYGDAFFKFIHALFAEYGLVIIDGDQNDFKQSFSNIMKKEIQTSFSFYNIKKTNQKLEQENFKIQVNPREINLFYLSENNRERIILNGNNFKIGDLEFTKNQIIDLIENEPGSFSPNVILRPLYQEFLLPNLCYVGGVGELSYWLQLKGVFESSEISFPLIQARTSALWIDSNGSQKLENFNLKVEDIFKPIHELKKQVLLLKDSENIDFELIDFQFNQFKTDFSEKANQIDSSLNSRIGAELTKIEKQIEFLKNQLEKSIKTKHERSLIVVEQLKNKLFPYNTLQERSVNFFQFCSDGKYVEKLHKLKTLIQPFDPRFLVIENHN